MGGFKSEPWAASFRYAGRLEIGTGGRLRVGMHGRHRRNTQFKQRIEGGRGKKTTIVAMARKLLVALWKYVASGVVIEGAVMKNA